MNKFFTKEIKSKLSKKKKDAIMAEYKNAMQKAIKSKCCKAPVTIGRDKFTQNSYASMWHVCTKCEQPCDATTFDSKKTS